MSKPTQKGSLPNACGVPQEGPCPGAMVASLLKLLTIQASHPSPQRANLIARQMAWLADHASACTALRQVSGELSDFWGNVAAATMPLPARR